MPTNKPMKMQWLTVDGRQVPSILPNHWNEQKNDWDITGTKNPLPIANYTQNASGVWLPTSESNPVPTQLTGSNIEEIVPVSAVAITDTTRRTTGVIDLSKYKKIILTVFSTLNQQVRIGASRGGGDWISFFDDQEWKRVAPPDADALQPGANNLSIANGQWPFLNGGLRQINLAYECQTAPTSGSLTVRIWGVPN